MKYVIIIIGERKCSTSEDVHPAKVFRGGTIQSAAKIAPPLCISSLRCKLDYFTCALSRTAKNFFGN